MTPLACFLLWLCIGALVYWHTIDEDSGPLWVTPVLLASWPLLLAGHYTNVDLRIGYWYPLDDEEGDD